MFTPSPDNDDCRFHFRRRPRVDTRARRERRIFRKSAGRLAACARESVILFRGDGQYRSKIGLSPSRARSCWPAATMGSGVTSLRSSSTHAPQMPTLLRKLDVGDAVANRSRGTSSTATTMVRPRAASLRSARSTNSKRPLPPSGFHPRKTSIHTFTGPSTSSVPRQTSIASPGPQSRSASTN